jgi:hypothetical protein
MKRVRGWVAALIVLGVIAPPEAVALTPGEWAIRNQLISDAKTAHANGDHAKALSLALRALALEATPSLHYFIAREEEETGSLADSYATAQQCGFEAERDTTLRSRDEILKGCHEIESRLKERIGYVVVDAKDRPAGLRVSLSGQELNEAALGSPYVVTPGTIVVEATAPGHSPYRLAVDVPVGKTINVSVTLMPTVVAVPLLLPAADAQSAAPTSPSVLVSEPAADRGGSDKRPIYRRTWFWGGLALVAVAVGTTAIILARSSSDYPNPTMGTFKAN